MTAPEHQKLKNAAAIAFRKAYHLYRLALRDAKKKRWWNRRDPLVPDGELYLSADPKIWDAVKKARHAWHLSKHPDPLIGGAERRLFERIRARELLAKRKLYDEIQSQRSTPEELQEFIRDRMEYAMRK